MKSGTYAIEELSKALSATAGNDKLPDGLSRTAVTICAKQVCLRLWCAIDTFNMKKPCNIKNVLCFKAFSEL